MKRTQFNEENSGAAEIRRTQTDEWLAVPPPAGRDVPSPGEEPGARPGDEVDAKPRNGNRGRPSVEGHVEELTRLSQRIEDAEARAQQAEARAAAAQQQADEAIRMEAELRAELAQAREALQARTKRSDARLRDAEEALLGFPKLAGEIEERLDSIERRVAEADVTVRKLAAPPGGASVTTSGLLDINRISFEQLRELGLSVTQAARLLATRDARGRFHSLDAIDDLSGFSREVVEQLKRHLRL